LPATNCGFFLILSILISGNSLVKSRILKISLDKITSRFVVKEERFFFSETIESKLFLLDKFVILTKVSFSR